MPRFLASLAALLVLTPSLFLASCVGASLAASPPIRTSDSTPATGAKDGPLQGVELAENAAAKSEAAEAWDSVKDTRNPALLEAFIKRFGTTFFAEIARARLDELKAAATRPPPPATAHPFPSVASKPAQSLPMPPPPPAPTDGLHQRAVLYDEDPASPTGRQFVGSVVWRIETIKAEGEPDELTAQADVDIPSRGLQMTMALRRNLDPSLSASHLIDLTFRVPTDFEGGGVANVPGILMKSNEQARGTPLAGLAVKVTGGVFMVGLSSAATNRERNLQVLSERTWFDIPIVYVNRRRAILAINKGSSGEQVFKTIFTAWGQYPDAMQPAAAIPEGDSGARGAR